MNAIDLSLLPPPEVIETLSFESLLDDYKADLVSRHPDIADTIDLESEPAVKLMEVSAYRELLLRARYNDEAKALLLAFSKGDDLDHIGVTYYQEPRLTITPADPAAVPPVAAVMESHDDYRYRLSLKPESYSVAGPRDAYQFHALSADGQVKNAAPTSPRPGTTEVFILSRTGNGVPDAPLLATVSAALNVETIRPESEEVIVSPGAVVNYTLEIGLIMFPGAIGEVAKAAAEAELDKFAADHHRLDADIVHSAIDKAAHQPGVKEVIIKSPPTKIVCSAGQAPYCIGRTVTIDGVEP
ncbi:MAG TPA: baseplate J/gp47 family protein [Rhodocyclaceae bacterium]|nr:baseplate J/gp47 family protein [Rhodocyclaceae bacterium]